VKKLLAVSVLVVASAGCGMGKPTIQQAESAIRASLKPQKADCSIKFKNGMKLSTYSVAGVSLTTFCRIDTYDPQSPMRACVDALVSTKAAVVMDAQKPECLALDHAGGLDRDDEFVHGLKVVPCADYDEVVVESVEASDEGQAIARYRLRPNKEQVTKLEACGEVDISATGTRKAILRDNEGYWSVR
jgi:hypothetical protein